MLNVVNRVRRGIPKQVISFSFGIDGMDELAAPFFRQFGQA